MIRGWKTSCKWLQRVHNQNLHSGLELELRGCRRRRLSKSNGRPPWCLLVFVELRYLPFWLSWRRTGWFIIFLLHRKSWHGGHIASLNFPKEVDSSKEVGCQVAHVSALFQPFLVMLVATSAIDYSISAHLVKQACAEVETGTPGIPAVLALAFVSNLFATLTPYAWHSEKSHTEQLSQQRPSCSSRSTRPRHSRRFSSLDITSVPLNGTRPQSPSISSFTQALHLLKHAASQCN